MTAEQIIDILGLAPLPQEGGLFRETYRTPQLLAPRVIGDAYSGSRSLSTAIYYLLIGDAVSAMHRLPGDEMFHFYAGDPVEMLQIAPDGTSSVVMIGTDLESGMRPQVVVPGRTWQGSRLAPGGRFALLGVTMSPGFDYDDYEHGSRDSLVALCPSQEALLRALTP